MIDYLNMSPPSPNIQRQPRTSYYIDFVLEQPDYVFQIIYENVLKTKGMIPSLRSPSVIHSGHTFS